MAPEPEHELQPAGAEGAAEPAAAVDPEIESRRAAALSFVRRLGDPILRSRATPVDRFDDSLKGQVARMAGLMHDALGLGLAAPQLGLSQRLLVYRVGPEAPVIALANPEVQWASSEEETLEEGCLSLPGVNVDVDRAIHVRVRAQDEQGEERSIEASGLEARVILHEMDHLDGVLILDRTSREQRRDAMRALREAERERSEQAA
ncbi:MAG: peptide deformylase [Thermoleophilaceae bacterium]